MAKKRTPKRRKARRRYDRAVARAEFERLPKQQQVEFLERLQRLLQRFGLSILLSVLLSAWLIRLTAQMV